MTAGTKGEQDSKLVFEQLTRKMGARELATGVAFIDMSPEFLISFVLPSGLVKGEKNLWSALAMTCHYM